MKKIVVLTALLYASIVSAGSCSVHTLEDTCFTTAFSSGYVFKHDDHNFKEVYGRGMGDIITVDGCYHIRPSWGIGGKFSYWLASGNTTFFKRRTFLHEVPVTFSVRYMLNCCTGFQLYTSLGGGVAWMQEESYLGTSHLTRGIGEWEGGFHYSRCGRLSLTSAFRYLFPRQSHNHQSKMDVGGFDLRVGLGVSF
ncbi:MAG: hypothetical protein WCE21_00200 [Candidatus Babeliales bacterium]